MTSNAFTSLANSRLHAPGRMVWNSCCPDKDLVVIFSRLGGSDRMALWSSSRGSRIWETDVSNGNGSSQVNAIAWSPDGQSIAVIREPPGISLHSLQDGRSLISLPLITPTGEPNTPFHVTGAWWFRDEKKEPKIANIPDIFKRNQIITGSAHSILKMLPLLDSLQEEPDKSTATDLFAFQGSHTRSSHKSQLPSIIENWPTLPADHMAASIESSSHSKQATDTAKLDEVATSNLDSILLVSDNLGRLFCYLDGAFPMGYISLGSEVDFISIVKHPQKPLFTGTPRSVQGKTGYVHLSPAVINIPLLSQRKCRDLANQSTTARELLWYTMRTIKELRETWCGSESITGAREYGMKWVQGLASKQKEQFGQSEPEPILDLTYLLTTGRISEPLMDFLGSGEQMSERGIHKWETSVTEALVKLRDFSEKRVAPALQRLHIVMEEVQGWGNLPEYASFELDVRELSTCLDLIGRGILLASWLGTSARRELHRFREFMAWLRYEILNLNAPRDENSYTRYDILEVNHYFMAGLETSTLDGWFMGPVPSFQLTDLGVAEYGNDQLEEVMEYARKVAADTSEMAWQKYDPPKDLSGVDRNIEALIQELGIQCGLFHHASQAASRSAVVSFDPKSKPERVPEKEPSPEHPLGFSFRERTILNESGEVNQHLISHQIPSLDKNTMLLCQLRFGVEASEFPSSIGGVLLQCYLPEEGDEESNLDLLDADFFDDECVVIIYRLRGGEKQAFIATLNYSDIGYQNLLHDGYVKGSSREDLMQLAVELWKDGQLPAVMAPINRRRALTGFKTGSVSTALNGRINRRLACVLDSTGTTLESFDLEGDTEDMEVGDG